MKKIITISICAVLLALLFVIGCKKSFLDSSDPNRLTEDKFWKTEADLRSAIASVYSPLRVPLSGYWGAFRGYQDINAMGDDVLTIPGGEPSTVQIAFYTYDAKNGDLESIFSQSYKSIYRANLVVANASKVPGLSATLVKEYEAEAKFLRGLNYFILASNYGDVPIKNKVQEKPEDAFEPTSPAADVYKQAIKDLSEAAEVLPLTRPSADLGRATKGAAIAFLGKAYLFTKDYANAETTLNKLLTAPFTYDLVPNFEDNFTDKNEFNKESVFEWVYGAAGSPFNPWGEEGSDAGMYNYRPQLTGSSGSGGWFKYIPSDVAIKAFKKEQRPIGSDTKFDKRMYATFMWKYSAYGEQDNTWYDNKTFDNLWTAAQTSIDRFDAQYKVFSEGKFLNKKFTNAYRKEKDADNYWGATPSAANVQVMRFAEVLLLHAEAALENNGNISKALQSINRVRNRAGLLLKTIIDLPNKEAVFNELKHQKLLELYFEQNRWNDLKRWYPDAASLKAYLTSVNKQGGANLMPKHYIFPLPAAELQTNKQATQHPLWK